MSRKGSIGVLLMAGVVAIAAWLLAPAFACSPGAALTLEGQAVPGQSVMVRGSLFQPDAGEALIWWNAENTLLLGHAQPDAAGQFLTSVVIPADAQPGPAYLVGAQPSGSTGSGRVDNNNTGPQPIQISSPPAVVTPPPPAKDPLSSTAPPPQPSPVAEPAPIDQRSPVATSPALQPAVSDPQVASSVEPTASRVVETPDALPTDESPNVPAEAVATGSTQANPVAGIAAAPLGGFRSGLLLGQPVAGQTPAVVPADDTAGPGAVVAVGAPAAVGAPSQSAVVLGTPPPTELGTSRPATMVLLPFAILGLALLGLGAELFRRRVTAEA